MSRPKLLPVLLILGVAALLVAVGMIWSFRRDVSLANLQKEGVIRVGYAVEAPYAYITPGEKITGESPEIAKYIISRLGIAHIEWRQVEFGSLISELQAGRIDVIAAGMFITPERAQLVSFSNPTFHVRQGLLVVRGNPRQIHAYEQFRTQSDLRVAVLAGSVEEKLLQQIGVQDQRRILVPDALTGRIAVETGIVDGLALSSLTIQWMALQDQVGKTEAALPFETSPMAEQERLGYGGFAFRKEDVQLLEAWNAALRPYLGSPEHLKLIAPFGFTSAELPGSITSSEIIAP